jgi:hypothetical protein
MGTPEEGPSPGGDGRVIKNTTAPPEARGTTIGSDNKSNGLAPCRATPAANQVRQHPLTELPQFLQDMAQQLGRFHKLVLDPTTQAIGTLADNPGEGVQGNLEIPCD